MNPKMPKSQTITEYIQSAPKESQKKLREMRTIIEKAAPKATEDIKWGMPAFVEKKILVMFGGFKNHIGLYPMPSVIKEFEKDLSKFEMGKGSIQFPLDKPLPKALITKIVKFRRKEMMKDGANWKE